MSITHAIAADLGDLTLDPIVAGGPTASLAALGAGHGMTEVAASCIGSPLLICSCCCCCAG